MPTHETLQTIRDSRMIAVIREESASVARDLANSLLDAGVAILEVTFTTPDAATLIDELSGAGAAIIAAGTVRTTDEVQRAADAGAAIIVSPHLNPRLIEAARRRSLISVAGAATPSEIIMAHEAGADVVKLYPALHLGGPSFVATVRQAIRGIDLIAGGPVGLDDIQPYLTAGCTAVNLGGALAPRNFIKDANWAGVRELAEKARATIRDWSRTSQ